VSSDGLDATLAAALVQTGYSFQTSTSKTTTGAASRVFQLLFELPGGRGQYLITSYVAGWTIVALAPFRITSDPSAAKRHEIADFLLPKVPFVRVMADLRGAADSANLAWLESAVPVSRQGLPVDELVVVAPINTIVSAMEALRSEFHDCTAAAAPLTVPMRAFTVEPVDPAAHADVDQADPLMTTPQGSE
jgi:hypothetical protein